MSDPETIYMLDSEFCSECGAILLYFECDLCDECREKMWANEEQWGDVYGDLGNEGELAHLAEYYDEEMIPETEWRL